MKKGLIKVVLAEIKMVICSILINECVHKMHGFSFHLPSHKHTIQMRGCSFFKDSLKLWTLLWLSLKCL